MQRHANITRPGFGPQSLCYHALAWAGFILYELSIVFYGSDTRLDHAWEYIGYYALNMLLFYSTSQLVLPVAFRTKSSGFLLFVLVPLQLSAYILLEYGLEHLYNLFRTFPRELALSQRFVVSFIWRGTYFIGLSTTFWFVWRTFRHQQRISRLELRQLADAKTRAELEKDLATTQSAYLQAQINPHFLFNTLNFIFNQVQEGAPKASESVLLLAEVMRHALTGVQTDGKTSLSDEVSHLRHYVSLNQLRFSYPLYLHLEEQGISGDYRLPPLLLLTFVENIFKHGDLTDAAYPATVQVACRDGWLQVATRNKKKPFPPLEGFGIGLRNVRTRLERLYLPHEYRLDIQEGELEYKLNFQLKLL